MTRRAGRDDPHTALGVLLVGAARRGAARLRLREAPYPVGAAARTEGGRAAISLFGKTAPLPLPELTAAQAAGLPMDTYCMPRVPTCCAGPSACRRQLKVTAWPPTEAERRFLQNRLARRPGGGCAPADGSPGGQ